MTARVLLAVLSGIIMVSAFPPFGLGFAAWFALVPLMYSINGFGGASKKAGFFLGLAFGFVFFLGTVYWVVNSMYHYGGVPMYASILVMLLLVLYLSVYAGLFGLLFSRLEGMERITQVVAAGAVWAALEYIRGHLFTGFPWVLAGYSQAEYLPVIQIADTTGVWGLSFLIAAVNTAAYLSARSFLRKEGRALRGEALVAVGLLASVTTYGFMRINQVDKEVFFWGKMKAGVAQGSIDQSIKWDSAYQDRTLEIYKDLSLKASKEGAGLIVWPETALPFEFEPEKVRNGAVGAIAKETGSYLLTGSPSYNYNQGTRSIEYFNSAYLLSPSGAVLGRYDKIHLVPFGEYVPLKRFLPFVRKLTAGVGDFAEGPGPIPIRFNDDVGIGTLVCFESIFPEIAAGSIRNGATILVNLTNDAWFGRTSAPYQHFGMSVLRAVENKSYLLRSANTGISAVIDPAGRVVKKSALFEKAVLVDTVALRKGPLTFYSSYGDVFAYGCLVMSGAFILSRFKRR